MKEKISKKRGKLVKKQKVLFIGDPRDGVDDIIKKIQKDMTVEDFRKYLRKYITDLPTMAIGNVVEYAHESVFLFPKNFKSTVYIALPMKGNKIAFAKK